MLKIDEYDIDKLIPYINNAKEHPEEQVSQIAASIKEFGMNDPIAIDEENVIIEGHGRLLACKKLGFKKVPVIKLKHLNEHQKKAYILAHNKLTLNSGFDMKLVEQELEFLKDTGYDKFTFFEEDEFDFNEEENKEVEEDDFEPPEDVEEIKTDIKQGDIIQLGNHRLMCGDSTSKDDVDKLMKGNKADLGHNDPPYGMKKENDGVLNDNLNYNDLLDFNKKWINLQFDYLKDNGSFYCWGTDEPLMDVYSEILKPLIKTQKVTFRNLITWDKGNGQGQTAEKFRMYSIADEKCLFVMCGVQGFNNNADNYFDAWEPIRDYLLKSRLEMGWSVPDMKKIVGHSDLSRDHWTSKSQFNMPTREVYEKMKAEADRKRNETKNDAFKKEYDELKKEYYDTRAYFNNTHDNMNNVWHIERTSNSERDGTGKHATPKPLKLCSRVINSSCKEKGLVVDVFGGSGSTLIACEQLDRVCYMMELDEKYCEVICRRWETLTGNVRELIKNV